MSDESGEAALFMQAELEAKAGEMARDRFWVRSVANPPANWIPRVAKIPPFSKWFTPTKAAYFAARDRAIVRTVTFDDSGAVVRSRIPLKDTPRLQALAKKAGLPYNYNSPEAQWAATYYILPKSQRDLFSYGPVFLAAAFGAAAAAGALDAFAVTEAAALDVTGTATAAETVTGGATGVPTAPASVPPATPPAGAPVPAPPAPPVPPTTPGLSIPGVPAGVTGAAQKVLLPIATKALTGGGGKPAVMPPRPPAWVTNPLDEYGYGNDPGLTNGRNRAILTAVGIASVIGLAFFLRG